MTPRPLVIIPTHNAAEHLEWCLQSVAGAHTAIYDHASTDDTRLIAARHPHAAVFEFEYNYARDGEMFCRAEMCRRALEFFPAATHIVTLDADEMLSDMWIDYLAALNPKKVCTLDYWQLMGDANWQQTGNPIERRPTIFPRAAGPLWVPQPGRNYHCGATFHGGDERWPWATRIHLGWTGDMRRRLKDNLDRGDWTGEHRARIEAATNDNPHAILPSVEPVAQNLLESCTPLSKIAAHHRATRQIVVADGRIKSVTYAG